MAITPDLLREKDVDEVTIQKVFGSKQYVNQLKILAPNENGGKDSIIARNPTQVSNWLDRHGAKIVV